MINPSNTVTRREWLAVLGVAMVTILVASWPWLTAGRNQPADTTYLGTNIPDVLDSQVYYAFIQANADGSTRYANLFTSEAQPAALVNPLWWLLGRVVAGTGLTVVTVFWVAKAVAGLGLIIFLYRLIAVFISAAPWRLVALGLAVFGSGLGWLALLGLGGHPGLIWAYQRADLVTTLPVDLTYPAGFVWAAMIHSPLYVVSLWLMLMIWWGLVHSLHQPRYIHLAGAATLVLGFIHPYDLILAAGVVVVGMIVGIIANLADQTMVKCILWRLGRLGLWVIPPMVYYGWLLATAPAIRAWNDQNVLMTTNLRTVIAGFAPAIVFSMVGIRAWWHHERKMAWLPLAWIGGALALMYIPIIQYQAKMILGLSVPLGLLSAVGLQHLWSTRWGNHPGRRIVAAVIVGAVFFSTPVVWLARVTASQHTEPRFHYASNDLVAALAWIRDTTPTTSIVLGDIWTGNLVPQYARRATYLGHHHQTIHFAKKLEQVRDWFFEDNLDLSTKMVWLNDQRITHIVVGPYERRQGAFDPELWPGLRRVMQRGDVAVYAVVGDLGD